MVASIQLGLACKSMHVIVAHFIVTFSESAATAFQILSSLRACVREMWTSGNDLTRDSLRTSMFAEENPYTLKAKPKTKNKTLKL